MAPPPPPRRWNQVLTQAAPFTVQLTIRPWILVPNARETLIWGSDFLFFWQRVPKTPCFRLRVFGVRMGWGGVGGGGYAPTFQNCWIRPWPPHATKLTCSVCQCSSVCECSSMLTSQIRWHNVCPTTPGISFP